jgi:hypothetical protein
MTARPVAGFAKTHLVKFKIKKKKAVRYTSRPFIVLLAFLFEPDPLNIFSSTPSHVSRKSERLLIVKVCQIPQRLERRPLYEQIREHQGVPVLS